MENLVSDFCSITGADENVARSYLEASNSNLQSAIDLFLNSTANEDIDGPTTSQASPAVRKPIPQTSGKLVTESFQASYAPVNKYRSKNSIFDRFRDFEAETEEQARIMRAKVKISECNETEREDHPIIDPNKGFSKRRTLESLFRPPLEIMHRGTFETARKEAVQKKQWLLVNIQNVEEFACQVLNRDVWNHCMVSDLIANNFVFWQIYHDSAEGNRFCTYYPVTSFPFVGVVDPQTGELVKIIRGIKDTVYCCDALIQFLETNRSSLDANAACANSSEQKTSPTTAIKRKFSQNAIDDDNIDPTLHKASRMDTQIETSKAFPDVRNGFKSTTHELVNGSCETNIWKNNSCSGEEVRLMFRLPNGTKQFLSLNYASELKVIRLYAQQELHLPFEDYDYVLNHPRRVLNDANENKTLSDVGMNKQELIYVERR